MLANILSIYLGLHVTDPIRTCYWLIVILLSHTSDLLLSENLIILLCHTSDLLLSENLIILLSHTSDLLLSENLMELLYRTL